MLERLDDDVSPDLVRDTLWAYDHLEHSGVKPDSAPSRDAWLLLKWAREYRSRFFESFLPKAKAAKGKDVVEEEQIMHKKSIEQIRGVLAKLVEASKPSDLNEAASDFVRQWFRTHGGRLSAEARRDLEAGIGRLVVSYRE